MFIREYIIRQFRRPRGYVGRLAGYVMYRRPSNRLRNAWTVDLLGLEACSDVLEVGCGPGLAIEACLEIVRGGSVTGLDHSEIMVQQALARLKSVVEEGRCKIHHCDLSMLSVESARYDRIFSINVVQFFPELKSVFRVLFSRLKPGGIVATTYMPRMKNATAEKAMQKATEVSEVMRVVGYTEIDIKTLETKPVPAICVIGRRP